MQENNAKRSHKRREARALDIPAAGAIEDFPIAKGGRCGRRKLEKVIQGLRDGDINSIREVLRDFDYVPQLQSAHLLAATINRADARDE